MAAKAKRGLGFYVFLAAGVMALGVAWVLVSSFLFPTANAYLQRQCERAIGYSRVCDCLGGAALSEAEEEAIGNFIFNDGLTRVDDRSATSSIPALEGDLAPLAQCHVTGAG